LRDRNCRQLDDCGAQTWFQGFKHLLPPPGSVAFGVAILENNVLATATLPRDLSPWGMFVNADSVVKAVLELQQPIVSGPRGAHADARHRARRHRRWNGQPSSGRSDRLIRVTMPSHVRFSACG
jgi:hypothetical protein